MIKRVILLLVSLNVTAHEYTPCVAGMADIYPCENVDLARRMHIDHIGGSMTDTGSDIWGWTDSLTNKEYALITLSNGTSFVDISDPRNPIYLGRLPTATSNSIWRDVKVYQNHAYIVSEASGHGMQVFDLTKLRDVVTPPIEFVADYRYTQFGNAHNIVINEDSGFAYAVGTGTCSSGLHMMNLQTPNLPTNAGCFSSDGYTHDAQCVMYIGPDNDYVGQELCFNSNEDTLTIVDVSVKNTPVQISRTGYSGSQYTHQGWLTEDQRYWLMNDELDEQRNGHNTRTHIWDLEDLEAPQLIGFYNGPKASIDHNLYVKGNYAYLTNYTSGLSIVDISDIGNANLSEVANFDGFPTNDNATFDGAWSNYPYFESGVVIMSDFDGGLFILEPNLCPTIAAPDGLLAQPNGDNSVQLDWSNDLQLGETYNVYRSEGGCAVDNFIQIQDQIESSQYIDNSVTGQLTVGYKVSKSTQGQACQSERSTCVDVQTTGICTAAPTFTGVSSVSSTNSSTCGMRVQWSQAQSNCGSNVTYSVYKSTNPAFIPSLENRVITGLNALEWTDVQVNNGQEYYYLVRSTDANNLQQDNNLLKLADTALGEISNGTWTSGAEIGDAGLGRPTRHVGWEINSNYAHSGINSYWSQNQSNTCNDLVTQTISLTTGESSQLSFWTLYDIESSYDGGVIEITTDKQQWQTPNLSPGYPGQFNSGNDACNYTNGTPSFTGINLNWQQHTMDLSSYQGQDINLRWNYSTDGSVNSGGWYVDDIAITNTQIPAACISLPDLIYLHGFE
jgi:choice-of-anchor B domain-containing protein